ncbi:hypothetical protein CEQ90_01905 [Lewinellaceae bacterium SD302]|nr:hypothetical protein CEQ90_01905 [Lewinellaceae bacterium SD302]
MTTNQETPLINRVANSGLVTIELENFYPTGELARFDLKDYLYMELILREKDFRAALAEHDWEQYRGKHLLVFCSADAIIPVWAYMLVASKVAGLVASIYQGEEAEFIQAYLLAAVADLKPEDYQDKRLVIKGCSDKPVPAAAYLAVTAKLQPVAKSIMYGEPCSTVPVYKKPRS